MSEKESNVEVEYPIRKNKKAEWTPEFRKEWNRQYRKEIKLGLRKPVARASNSKWKDPVFRKSYESLRSKKIAQERTEKKMSFNDESFAKRPNFTKAEKEEILNKMIELIREGKDPEHPFFTLSLAVKKQYKRVYPPKTNISSS